MIYNPKMDVINAAAVTTDQIMVEVSKAYQIIGGPFQCNGFGVFADPRNSRAVIRSAIERLKAAEAIFESAKWPAHADYDEGEGYPLHQRPVR